jgi:hypothetical protein
MSADIAPDIHCPHCGWVILCPHVNVTFKAPEAALAPQHTPGPHSTRETFLQLVRRRQAAERKQPPAATPTATRGTANPGTNPAYVTAAIQRDLDRLAATHEGARNGTLHAVACNVFEFVKAGHADQNACRAELERIATAIGLPHSEIQSTLRSAWQRVGPRAQGVTNDHPKNGRHRHRQQPSGHR